MHTKNIWGLKVLENHDCFWNTVTFGGKGPFSGQGSELPLIRTRTNTVAFLKSMNVRLRHWHSERPMLCVKWKIGLRWGSALFLLWCYPARINLSAANDMLNLPATCLPVLHAVTLEVDTLLANAWSDAFPTSNPITLTYAGSTLWSPLSGAR